MKKYQIRAIKKVIKRIYPIDNFCSSLEPYQMTWIQFKSTFWLEGLRLTSYGSISSWEGFLFTAYINQLNQALKMQLEISIDLLKEMHHKLDQKLLRTYLSKRGIRISTLRE